MKTILLFFLLGITLELSAQGLTDCADDTGPIYKLVEDMPHPTGCQADTHDGLCLRSHVQNYIQSHPDFQSLIQEAERTVHLTYTVGLKGCISNVLVRREEIPGSGDVIGRILSSMPLWKPGKTLQKPVSVRQHLTIHIPKSSEGVGLR